MIHTKFSGSNGQNAHRWLRTLRYENPEITTISPSDWLGVIDGLLEGDAATWADHHPRVKHILRAGSLKKATRADVETFKKALIARFPPVEVKTSHFGSGPTISSPVLEQAPNEALDSYYQRTLLFLYHRNGVDLAESPLTEQEHDALKKTVRSYIAGLIDDETRGLVEKLWAYVHESISLQRIHEILKDKNVLKRLAEKQKYMEKPMPGQAASDWGLYLNRANVPSNSSDNAVFTSDMGNLGSFSDARPNFDHHVKPNEEKHAAGADDMPSSYADFMKDHPNVGNEMPTVEAGTVRNFLGRPESADETPSSKYGPLPELRPWNPSNPTTSTWNQVRDPPPNKGFISRIGNSNHTPNTSNGSNPPTTLPNANMFGGGTGTPSRPQSSLFGESPPYSIFDDRHPANVNWTAHPAYGTNNKYFGDGSFTGANCGNPPQHCSGMPPPGLSRFKPLNKQPSGGLFGDGPSPGRPAKGTSPNRHSRRPSNLEVETHLRPSSLSEDTVRQFYSPGRNIFGNFSTKCPSDVPDAADPSNTAANISAPTSHQRPNIQIQTSGMNSSISEDSHACDDDAAHQAATDRFLRAMGVDPHQASNFRSHAPSHFGTPDVNTPVPKDRQPQEPNLPSETTEDLFLRYFGPNRQQGPVPNVFNTPGMRLPVIEDHHARDPNNPFKDSMDQFMRELNLNTHPSDADIGLPHDTYGGTTATGNEDNNNHPPFPSPIPKTPTTAVFSPPTHSTANTTNPNPPTASYSQAVNTHTNTHAPFQPIVESDPETESGTEPQFQPEIPITIKQSQGVRKKRRGHGRS